MRSIGSQIGRNIKSLAQVLWFALYTLIKFDGDEDSIDLLALVRVVYYMSKMSCVLFNEHQVVWTPGVFEMFKRLLRTINAYLAREMEDILIGAKSHDLLYHLLEDVIRHGSPAGFDCSPGESKMRVQKLKNYFSNKSAPSLDVARKIMKTEIADTFSMVEFSMPLGLKFLVKMYFKKEICVWHFKHCWVKKKVGIIAEQFPCKIG